MPRVVGKAESPLIAEHTNDCPFDLERFVVAQNAVLPQVLDELRAGRKRSHWMWFIFPQMKGLGRSSTALHFGIASLDEAVAYLAHPVLGPRLEQCTETALAHSTVPLLTLFGSPDDLKFHSSMTLFDKASSNNASLYRRALSTFWKGAGDAQTLNLLSGLP